MSLIARHPLRKGEEIVGVDACRDADVAIANVLGQHPALSSSSIIPSSPVWISPMARYRVLYWHTIPSVVEARDGDTVHKEELSSRFQMLIDRVAMKRKLVGTDAYLEGWHKGRPQTREGSAEDVARDVAKNIESEYEKIAATALDTA